MMSGYGMLPAEALRLPRRRSNARTTPLWRRTRLMTLTLGKMAASSAQGA